MKKCPYCGKEYPDEVSVCAIDGEALSDGSDAVANRKKISGVWRGVYGYGPQNHREWMKPVGFTLKLKQGWLDHFTGSVTEDAPDGMPGTGAVDGYYKLPQIEFTKQMPVGYVFGSDGKRQTLREYLVADGFPCKSELPSPPVLYLGTMLDADRAQGTWVMNPQRIQGAGNRYLPSSPVTGYWCAQFISTDIDSNPTDGPPEMLFDKTLLSPRELEDVEGPVLKSLGKFNVADAERCLERFGQEDIRFKLNRDDTAMRQMMPFTEVTGGYSGTAEMVEILVHPDDEERAVQILNENTQV
jgi:hypothetical protein